MGTGDAVARGGAGASSRSGQGAQAGRLAVWTVASSRWRPVDGALLFGVHHSGRGRRPAPGRAARCGRAGAGGLLGRAVASRWAALCCGRRSSRSRRRRPGGSGSSADRIARGDAEEHGAAMVVRAAGLGGSGLAVTARALAASRAAQTTPATVHFDSLQVLAGFQRSTLIGAPGGP